MDFSLFFTQLSVGCVWLLLAVPWRTVGKGYYVMMLSIGLGLVGVSWLFIAGKPTGLLATIGSLEGIQLLMYTVAVAAALIVFLAGRGELGANLSGATSIFGTAAMLADMTGVKEASTSPAATKLLLAFNFVSSALLLGSVLSAMLLGHWYLVVKDLPVEPLKRLTRIFFVALGARLAATAAAFIFDPAGGRHVVDRSFLFVLVYGLFSLGCPIAMSWMVWGTVKIRSTQAATGILYGVVAFILMGEAAGRFILIKTGFPI